MPHCCYRSFPLVPGPPIAGVKEGVSATHSHAAAAFKSMSAFVRHSATVSNWQSGRTDKAAHYVSSIDHVAHVHPMCPHNIVQSPELRGPGVGMLWWAGERPGWVHPAPAAVAFKASKHKQRRLCRRRCRQSCFSVCLCWHTHTLCSSLPLSLPFSPSLSVAHTLAYSCLGGGTSGGGCSWGGVGEWVIVWPEPVALIGGWTGTGSTCSPLAVT